MKDQSTLRISFTSLSASIQLYSPQSSFFHNDLFKLVLSTQKTSIVSKSLVYPPFFFRCKFCCDGYSEIFLHIHSQR